MCHDSGLRNVVSYSVALVVAVAALISAAPATAGKALTVPVSNNTIEIELCFRDYPRPVRVLVQEGGLIKFGDTLGPNTTAYGLVPILRQDGGVEFTVFEIGVVDAQNETMRQVEKLRATREVESRLTAVPARIKVRQIKLSSAPPVQPVGDDCCVYCDFWACGNGVWMSCGCCCDPGFCGSKTDPKNQC